jgi:hypothetical protein
MLYTSKSYPNVHFLLTKEAIIRFDTKISSEKRIQNTLFVIGQGSNPEELKNLREEIDGWITNVLGFEAQGTAESSFSKSAEIENVLKMLI